MPGFPHEYKEQTTDNVSTEEYQKLMTDVTDIAQRIKQMSIQDNIDSDHSVGEPDPRVEQLLTRIENDYKFHAPSSDAIVKAHETIRSSCKELAKTIIMLTPISREQSQALSFLELAGMEANAAIARYQTPQNG